MLNETHRRLNKKKNRAVDRDRSPEDERYDRLTELLENSGLPPQNIRKFNGDTTMYYSFKNNFQKIIGNQTRNHTKLLNYLVEYCEGPAQELIETCQMGRNPSYTRAWELLDRQYGRPFVIAADFVKKLTAGPKIGKNDNEGLRKLAMSLSRAESGLEDLACSGMVDNPMTITKIADRLPPYMKRTWGVKASKKALRRPSRSLPNL